MKDTDTQAGESRDDVAALTAALQKCELERQEYLDGWQRMRADVINTKRETDSAVARATQHAKIGFAEDLLMALDSFDAAMAGDAWQKVDPAWRTGVEYIRTQLTQVMERNGVSSYGTPGDLFDHALHEAAEEVPAGGTTVAGSIARVLQKGYRAGDMVLRPARVVVAR